MLLINKRKIQTWKKSLEYSKIKPLRNYERFMFTNIYYDSNDHFMRVNGDMHGCHMVYEGQFIPKTLYKMGFDEEKFCTDNIMDGELDEKELHHLFRLIWN
jgi:hypothetical protein